MKRSPHLARHGVSLHRSRRRRKQLKAIHRAQSKRRLTFFRLENV